MSIDLKIPNTLAQRITAQQAFHYRIVPKQIDNNGKLIFNTDTENTQELLSELQILMDYPLAVEKIDSGLLQDFLTANYRLAVKKVTNNLKHSNDFLDKILINAKDIGSSDIHFEPYEEECRVRFRVDGKLIEQFRITKTEYPVIINKIKIKAELDIAEKRLPQDGRISLKSFNEDFDIRVSTLPTLFGEKIVLRILNRDATAISLEALGFHKTELDRYKQNIGKSNGIILISGPTGSGKTTTLYATLKLLNKPETNILTIEDPVEYTLKGVNQVQLKESIGLDFPHVLESFLRQDPNIIMVGEIRNVNTANMAMRLALTGRLVLSTIHTNSAWGTITRLIDMGIPPFLIASILRMSIAQRLVRKLCEACKIEKSTIDDPLVKKLVPKNLKSHFIASGCPKCHHTGYKGRKAIYEILPVSKDLVKEIKNNSLDISAYLKENKIATLGENALRMVQEGNTSIEEVYTLLTD